MKRMLLASFILFLFSASIVIFQVSCSSDVLAQTNCTDPTTTLSFIGNGIQYNINGSLDNVTYKGSIIRKSGNFENFYYVLDAEYKSSNSNASQFLTIPLAAQRSQIVAGATFTSASTNFLDYLGAHFLSLTYDDANGANDNFVPNITSVENGYASGTFNATIVKAISPARIFTITQGQFTNVKILD